MLFVILKDSLYPTSLRHKWKMKIDTKDLSLPNQSHFAGNCAKLWLGEVKQMEWGKYTQFEW